MATPLPTSIAGSLPKPAWLAEPGKLWPEWRQRGAGGKWPDNRCGRLRRDHALGTASPMPHLAIHA